MRSRSAAIPAPPSARRGGSTAPATGGGGSGGSDWIGPGPAGLRAIRHVAEADGIDEWLMVETPAPEDDRETETASAPHLVRVLPPGRERAASARMIAAADRLDSPHISSWTDLDDGPDGELRLSRDWLPQGTLDALLASRERLSAGEAVTILAPVLETLADAHRLGVTFGDLRGASIAFTSAGAPVVEVRESCALHEPGLPPAALASHPDVTADRTAALALCRRVAERVHGAGAAALRALVCAPDAAPTTSDSTADVDDGVHLENLLLGMFDIAAGSPVRFASEQEQQPEVVALTIPGRVDLADLSGTRRSSSAGDVGVGHGADTQPSAYRARWASVLQVPQWLDPLIARAVEGDPARSGRQAARRLWSSLSWRTRRLAVAGAAAGATAAVAVLLVPSGEAVPSRADDMSSTAPSGESPAGGGTAGADAPSSPAPGKSADTHVDEPAGESDDAAAAVRGDDPVAAASVLLDARDRCLRDLDALCLRDVHQLGSIALTVDVAMIEAIEAGNAPDDALAVAGGSPPVLAERLGDSAILLIGPETSPASLLLMRSEAGWRIRELREPAG